MLTPQVDNCPSRSKPVSPQPLPRHWTVTAGHSRKKYLKATVTLLNALNSCCKSTSVLATLLEDISSLSNKVDKHILLKYNCRRTSFHCQWICTLWVALSRGVIQGKKVYFTPEPTIVLCWQKSTQFVQRSRKTRTLVFFQLPYITKDTEHIGLENTWSLCWLKPQ